MNLEKLQKTILAAARRQTLDDRVPYAFEQRIVALIAARGAADVWAFWTRNLWRAAASCVGVAVVCGATSLFAPGTTVSKNDLSQDFEITLLASVDQGDSVPTP